MAASRSSRVTRSSVGLNGVDNFCGRTLRNRSIAQPDDSSPPPAPRARSPKKKQDCQQQQQAGAPQPGTKVASDAKAESEPWPTGHRKRGLSCSEKDDPEKGDNCERVRGSVGPGGPDATASSPALKRARRCSRSGESQGAEDVVIEAPSKPESPSACPDAADAKERDEDPTLATAPALPISLDADEEEKEDDPLDQSASPPQPKEAHRATNGLVEIHKEDPKTTAALPAEPCVSPTAVANSQSLLNGSQAPPPPSCPDPIVPCRNPLSQKAVESDSGPRVGGETNCSTEAAAAAATLLPPEPEVEVEVEVEVDVDVVGDAGCCQTQDVCVTIREESTNGGLLSAAELHDPSGDDSSNISGETAAAALASTPSEMSPSEPPSSSPSEPPSSSPSEPPSSSPSEPPSSSPSEPPSSTPSEPPSSTPSEPPSSTPSEPPSFTPSEPPSSTPSEPPLSTPSEPPSSTPSEPPSSTPSEPPSSTPSEPPSSTPSEPPSSTPSEPPSSTPSEPPSSTPSEPPSSTPSEPPSSTPSEPPSSTPSEPPSSTPSEPPSSTPSEPPSSTPSEPPSSTPSEPPSFTEPQEHRYTLRTSPRRAVSCGSGAKVGSPKPDSPHRDNGSVKEEATMVSPEPHDAVCHKEPPSDGPGLSGELGSELSEHVVAVKTGEEVSDGSVPRSTKESTGSQVAEEDEEDEEDDEEEEQEQEEEEEEDPDVYYFESDHLALKHNKDYQRLLQTIGVLEAQRTQAILDLETLARHQREALADPIIFVEQLQKQMEMGLPCPQRVVQLPDIAWDQYTSGLGDFEREFCDKKRKTRRLKLIFDKVGLPVRPKSPVDSKKEPDTSTLYSALPSSDALENSISSSRTQMIRGRLCHQSKPDTFNQLWTVEEQKKLEQLLLKFPPEEVESKRWQKIADELGNRTAKQVASRVQKYFIKLTKAGIPVPGRTPNLCMYSKKASSKRQHHLNKHLYRPSTFLTSYEPPVYMDDEDDHAGFFSSLQDNAADDSDEDEVPVELRHLPEFMELLELKRLKKQKLQEIQAESVLAQHMGYKCDLCGMEPIQGVRWHCQDCPPDNAIDFCGNCSDCLFKTETHKPNHRLEPVYQTETFLDRDYCLPQSAGYNYLDPNYFPANR